MQAFDCEESHKKSIFVAAFMLFWQEGHVEMVMLHAAGHNVHVDDLPGINMHFMKAKVVTWKTVHGTHVLSCMRRKYERSRMFKIQSKANFLDCVSMCFHVRFYEAFKKSNH